jgi:hypothetical protein
MINSGVKRYQTIIYCVHYEPTEYVGIRLLNISVIYIRTKVYFSDIFSLAKTYVVHARVNNRHGLNQNLILISVGKNR